MNMNQHTAETGTGAATFEQTHGVPLTDRERLVRGLWGAYVTIPTFFKGPDYELDLSATRTHVRFLLAGGLHAENAAILSGGAAGDFSTMTFDERIQVAETIVEEAGGLIPVIMGAQTTSTLELIRLAKAAERLGARYIQVSPPFYFEHTEEDFYEYVRAAAEAANVGIVIYNTYWTSAQVSLDLVERLVELPNVVGLKWATPRTDAMEFERVITTFADRLCVIDNHIQYAVSHMLGAKGFEAHSVLYWPEWGVRLWQQLGLRHYEQVQKEIMRVASPFYALWTQMQQYTSGDGYLDKLCLELIGLPGGPCRPPTRDLREQFREKARRMLIDAGVPRLM